MKVSELFDIDYGQSLSLNHLRRVEQGDGIAFVSRTAKNNGVSAWVEELPGVAPLPAGLLTVSLRSRNYALATFVQPRDFYCGYHIYVLSPKLEMTLQEKLWWAECIQKNRFRYNFGRQANRSLAGLELPDQRPAWVDSTTVPGLGQRKSQTLALALDHPEDWTPFRLETLFDVKRGRNVLKRNMSPGKTAYIGASASNNGITAWISEPPDFVGGEITLSANGSVGEAFYQPFPFVASGDVNVLVPRFEMDRDIALFICTLLYAEKFRWNYGRKWVLSRVRESVIRLPVKADGFPDWQKVRAIVVGQPLTALLPAE